MQAVDLLPLGNNEADSSADIFLLVFLNSQLLLLIKTLEWMNEWMNEIPIFHNTKLHDWDI